MRYEHLEVREEIINVPEQNWTDDADKIHTIPAHTLIVLEAEFDGQVYGMTFSNNPVLDARLYPELKERDKDLRQTAFSRYLYEQGVLDEAL